MYKILSNKCFKRIFQIFSYNVPTHPSFLITKKHNGFLTVSTRLEQGSRQNTGTDKQSCQYQKDKIK